MSTSSLQTLRKHRLYSFLIWQTIPTTTLFMILKLTLLPSQSLPLLILQFTSFHLSHLLFSLSLFSASSPSPRRPVSVLHLPLQVARAVLVPGGGTGGLGNEMRMVGVVVVMGVAGVLGVVGVCWGGEIGKVLGLGLRGGIVGVVYGGVYVWREMWVLRFPIVQRPPFFRFKMGLPSAVTQALQLSSVAFLSSVLLSVFIPNQLRSHATTGKFLIEQTIFVIGSFTLLSCWEITHQLHEVLHTKRFVFAPPKGSAAAETNPSEPLLAALEESSPRSLLQYLAYLDLCMVCEKNVDTWRRAAFFEETGETYKRVIVACLRPLEELASKLGEGLESSIDKSNQLSKQLQPPTESQMDPKYYEPLNDLQLSAWCARTAASLTARSHKEDRFGVAQLSGSNAAVISTLISCLLAVETIMGKKTGLQSLNGSAGFRPAFRRDTNVAKKRGGPIYSKAYAMADILRTSIYSIVNAFHEEMTTSDKANRLENDWIISGKPLYGSRELLLHKLRLFLDYQAC